MRLLFFVLLVMPAAVALAQTGNSFRISSAHTSFPDTGRVNGHRYNNVLYPVQGHYDDSTVLIVVPPGFNAGKKVDIVCWFHGWYNHIDSVLSYFEIAQQFTASGRNAILVIPESAKDAPDSYGGKLEQQGRFRLLLEDVLAKLKKEKIVSKKATAGNIILAGHSGAYRVMAFILQQGALRSTKPISSMACTGRRTNTSTGCRRIHRTASLISIRTRAAVPTTFRLNLLND